MTLSCADLIWTGLFEILARIEGNDLTDEHVDALSYIEVSDAHVSQDKGNVGSGDKLPRLPTLLIMR